MSMLIYGCGIRLQECLNLRIKDVDCERGMLIVRVGKNILGVKSPLDQ